MSAFQWEEARYFLAVARAGQIKRAATQLGISAITLSRHLAHLQSKSQTQLFYRHPQGVRLTDDGVRLMEHLERIEAEFEAAGELILGSASQALNGLVRIAAPEGFALKVLSKHLVQYQALAPDVRIELVPQTPGLSLSRREADIAVMVGRPTERSLVAESLGHYRLGVFASESYLASHGKPTRIDELQQHTLIGYVDDLLFSQSLNVTAAIWPRWESHYAIYSPVGQVTAVQSGLGIGVLHEFLIDPSMNLIRVLPEIRVEREFYAVTHQALERVPRIRHMMQFLQTLMPSVRV